MDRQFDPTPWKLLAGIAFLGPGGPTGGGWTLYPPQVISPGTPGVGGGILLMLVSLIVFIAGFTMGGLNYVVTVLQARTRGMTLMRLPLTVWGIFMATVMALLAFPALLVAVLMLLCDMLLGTSFFMPEMLNLGEQAGHEVGVVRRVRCDGTWCIAKHRPPRARLPHRVLHRRVGEQPLAVTVSVQVDRRNLGAFGKQVGAGVAGVFVHQVVVAFCT